MMGGVQMAKYTRKEETTYTFSDDIGIHEEYSYHDDDGQSGCQSRDITDARNFKLVQKAQGLKELPDFRKSGSSFSLE